MDEANTLILTLSQKVFNFLHQFPQIKRVLIEKNSQKFRKNLKVLIKRYATFHINFQKLKGIGQRVAQVSNIETIPLCSIV